MAEVVGEGGIDAVMDRAVPKLTPFHDAAVTRQRIAEWAIRAHTLGREGKFDGHIEALSNIWAEIDSFYARNPESKL